MSLVVSFANNSASLIKKQIENIFDLERILADYKEKKNLGLDKNKKEFGYVAEYVRDGFHVYYEAFGNPIVKRIKQMVNELTCELTEPEDYKLNRNCNRFLQCLLDLGSFFVMKYRVFLPSENAVSPLRLRYTEVNQIFPPLEIPDACSFLILVGRQVAVELNRSQIIVILNILACAFMQGLFDNVIGVLCDLVGCKPVVPCPSHTFPLSDEVADIDLAYYIFLDGLSGLNKIMGCDIKKVMMENFEDQFFGRLKIEMRIKKEKEIV